MPGEAGAEALRSSLRRSVQDSMVSGAFVMLEALPLTSRGELDRRALPAPESAGGTDPLAPLPVPYAGHAVRQRAAWERPELERRLGW